MNTILIIDDEEKLRSLMARIISLEGFEVLEAPTCKVALKKLETNPISVVLCDVKLPDGNGVEFIKTIKTLYPTIEGILLTAYGNIPDGVLAIKNGAFDYLIKGDDNNKIIPTLNRAIQKIGHASPCNTNYSSNANSYSFDNIIGKSPIITQVISIAKKVSVSDTTVLLLGETGTGKEVFAQAIHTASPRNAHPFVAINCSAFSRELLESELFGHKAGSFTGASKDKKGLFEEAHLGTIFLDEIGEMDISLQAKLLRVLETGSFIKIGETKLTQVHVRIIAATNRTLTTEIAKGNFRSDLYYRLSVFEITLPPLKERKTDIPQLATHFVNYFTEKNHLEKITLTEEYVNALCAYDWPGNIRELKNVIERSMILANNALIVDTLPLAIIQELPVTKKGSTMSAFELSSVEKLHIQKVLNYTNNNKTETARLLNIGISTLYRKIEEYGLG